MLARTTCRPGILAGVGFTGWPVEGVEFCDGLEVDNRLEAARPLVAWLDRNTS